MSTPEESEHKPFLNDNALLFAALWFGLPTVLLIVGEVLGFPAIFNHWVNQLIGG
jgi:hypothetical protein